MYVAHWITEQPGTEEARAAVALRDRCPSIRKLQLVRRMGGKASLFYEGWERTPVLGSLALLFADMALLEAGFKTQLHQVAKPIKHEPNRKLIYSITIHFKES